jgi:uncharacterized protein YjbI with pentapeptide repeats
MNRVSAYFTVSIITCSCLFASNAGGQKINFSNNTIREPVSVEFWKKQIQDTLKGVEIDSSTYFWPRVIFHRPISFFRTHFAATADFMDAQFASTADFIGAHFDSTANFGGAQFADTADFNEAQFDPTVNFALVQFDFTADFSDAQFDSTADFRDAQFQGEVDFYRAKLPDNLDFRYITKINYPIDFTYCRPPRQGAKCRIALEGADIGKLKLNMNVLELWFPQLSFITLTGSVDTIAVRDWSGVVDTTLVAIEDTIIYPTPDQKVSIYEQVLKKLKDDGLMESYQILDIDYRRFKYDHKDWPLVGNRLHKYVINPLQTIWWNFGYDKERVLFGWTPGLFLFFTIINLFKYRKLTDEIYVMDFLQKMPYRPSKVRQAAKRLLQVATYTAIVFFWLKLDAAKFKKGAVRQHPWLFSYLISIYVVGLVCVGFIVNIIFTK